MRTPCLCLVAGPDDCAGRPLTDVVLAAVEGGVSMVQLRDKTAPDEQVTAMARALLPALRARNVPLIINDRAQVAADVDADGLHIGQSDMDPAQARRLIGPDRLLGVSVKTIEQARAAETQPVDYFGSGAAFASGTKPDSHVIDRATLTTICEIARRPVLAIGGIGPDNVASLAGTGISGVAVVSAITTAGDPRAAATAIVANLTEVTK